MCVISMVMDYYKPMIPDPGLVAPTLNSTLTFTSPYVDLEELRKLIDEFKQAVEAAKKVDILTGQPDCVDPEKAKLEERVARLEKIIDVLLAGGAK